MSVLGILGRLAAGMRELGLIRVLAFLRDSADRLLLSVALPPLRAESDGIAVRGFLRHRSFLAGLARGYEPLSRRLFLDALADADLVLDVGAHVGFYSLLAATRRPQARVVALEPDPYNAAALRVNLRNAPVRVEILQAAASDRSGYAVFRQSSGTVGSSLVDRRDIGAARAFEVETVTLDEVAGTEFAGSVIVKLDVEGAEPMALAGMRALSRSARRVTAIVEVNPRALADGGSSGAEVIATLRELGFDVKRVDEASGSLVAAGDGEAKGNLFCVRQ